MKSYPRINPQVYSVQCTLYTIVWVHLQTFFYLTYAIFFLGVNSYRSFQRRAKKISTSVTFIFTLGFKYTLFERRHMTSKVISTTGLRSFVKSVHQKYDLNPKGALLGGPKSSQTLSIDIQGDLRPIKRGHMLLIMKHSVLNLQASFSCHFALHVTIVKYKCILGLESRGMFSVDNFFVKPDLR